MSFLFDSFKIMYHSFSLMIIIMIVKVIRTTEKCINEMHKMRPARAQVYTCSSVLVAIYKI